MHTLFISHPDCLEHDTGPDHPEAASRLHAIEDRLNAAQLFCHLRHMDAPEVTREQLLRVHAAAYLDSLDALLPSEGYVHLDPDTVISPGSLKAARRAAGAVILATDLVMAAEQENAFCSVRPPGHHAERNKCMGFCLYNNVAIGVAHALAVHGLERIAILDFDVHHGNGSEAIFRTDRRVLFCSSFQHPCYPGIPCQEAANHVVCAPLAATAKSADFRAAIEAKWLPALEHFRPQMFFVSAGFDAHIEDDIAGIALTEHDYRWITEKITDLAQRHADKRIVSVLEGGYALSALARSVEAHLRVLMDLH